MVLCRIRLKSSEPTFFGTLIVRQKTCVTTVDYRRVSPRPLNLRQRLKSLAGHGNGDALLLHECRAILYRLHGSLQHSPQVAGGPIRFAGILADHRLLRRDVARALQMPV